MNKGKLITLSVIIIAMFLIARFAVNPAETQQAQCVHTGNLCGDWQLSYAEQPLKPARTPKDFKALEGLKTIPAKVPGNVELDLVREGLEPDPRKGDNVYKFRKYESYQWMYSKEFDSPKLEKSQRAYLKFEGIDTLADIFVNGNLVASPENMFLVFEYDITDFLSKKGKNKLDVILRSAPIESTKYDAIYGGGTMNRSELVHIRKAPASFGWDIHPRLVTAGLWRPVSLEVRNDVFIKDFAVLTKKVDTKKNSASFFVEATINAPHKKLDELKTVLRVYDGEKIIYADKVWSVSNVIKTTKTLNNIKLWWPRGYGEQKLYDVVLLVHDKDGKLLDQKKKSVGFRTVKLEFKELEIPEGTDLKVSYAGNVSGKAPKGTKIEGEFKFSVNGVPIFMKGTNWVPLDASHSRDIEHIKPAVDMLVDLNCNMIRLWGGNTYENDLFYDLCDKYGILVWQDFSMGCSVYPQTQVFHDKIREEIASIVKRLRSRTCIALWAGNNENDQAYSWVQGESDQHGATHDKLSREVIPSVIREYDWERPYIPSSPYLTEKTRLYPQKYAPPEVHMWGPRGYYKAPFYTEAVAVFVSEIGYHGCPNRESLEKMMDKKYVYPWDEKGNFNKQWQAKAVMPYANAPIEINRNKLMTKQATIIFGDYPRDLDDFIFASQVVQAEAKKYFIEMWRTQKFEPKTGILWWNLRDAWPILSDAIVDYYNSKKLAYHYIKRVQTDVCVMINDSFEVIVANDTPKKSTGKVRVIDVDSKKEVFSGKFEVAENAKTLVGKIDAPEGQGMFLIEYELEDGKKQLNHYMYGKPPFKLADYKKWYKALEL